MANVYLDTEGCLHIKDDKLIDEIKRLWGDNPASICVVLEGKKSGGGGGAPANSMCNCVLGMESQNRNDRTYP